MIHHTLIMPSKKQPAWLKFKLRKRVFILSVALISVLSLWAFPAKSNLALAYGLPQSGIRLSDSVYARGAATAKVNQFDKVYPPNIEKLQSSAEDWLVIRLIYATQLATPAEAQAKLDSLAAWLDIWDVDPDTRTLTAMVWPDQYAALMAAGYSLTVEARSGEKLSALDTSCYRTVEQIYATLAQTITATYPNITRLVDYGDSWEKVMPAGQAGYDLYALEITNRAMPDPKPVAVIDAGIHAREMAPPEVATALIDFLTANYGLDPDVTWLVDHHKIVISPLLNPDGHKLVKQGDELWRKNTDNDDGCTDPTRWGTDLNRNFDVKWACCGNPGASFPCNLMYRGPAPLSEPEAASYADYISRLIPDQWEDWAIPAPVTTTGILVDLHSFGSKILYPWSWTGDSSPNEADLHAIAAKYATFNAYDVTGYLYQADGTVFDWGYGKFGIPSFTVEAGTAFQDCTELPDVIADNLPGLFYFIRIARSPYRLVHGPDIRSLAALSSTTVTSSLVELTAVVDDTENGAQTVGAASYYIDVPPWSSLATAVSHPMTAQDGAFDETSESVQASVNTSHLSPGRHIIFVQGQDNAGNWGPVWSTWLTVSDRIYLPAIFKSSR